MFHISYDVLTFLLGPYNSWGRCSVCQEHAFCSRPYPYLSSLLPFTHQANISSAQNQPRARYQRTRDSPYVLKSIRVIKTSLSYTVYTARPCLFCGNPKKAFGLTFTLPLLLPDQNWSSTHFFSMTLTSLCWHSVASIC